MEKQFVPYDRALKLKELGFDEECFAYFTVFEKFSGDVSNGRRYNSEFEKSGGYISTPLWQQAFDWFREEHNLFSQTPSTVVDEEDRIFYNNPIYDKLDNIVFESEHQFDTYQEAQLACLDKLIEIVEENK